MPLLMSGSRVEYRVSLHDEGIGTQWNTDYYFTLIV